MPFRIGRAISPRAVGRALRLLDDRSTRLPGSFRMLVDIVHIYVEALRHLAETLRVPILRTRKSHHDEVIAELHRSMAEFSVGSLHCGAGLSEPKRLRQELQRTRNILIIKIDCDRHVLASVVKDRALL